MVFTFPSESSSFALFLRIGAGPFDFTSESDELVLAASRVMDGCSRGDSGFIGAKDGKVSIPYEL